MLDKETINKINIILYKIYEKDIRHSAFIDDNGNITFIKNNMEFVEDDEDPRSFIYKEKNEVVIHNWYYSLLVLIPRYIYKNIADIEIVNAISASLLYSSLANDVNIIELYEKLLK